MTVEFPCEELVVHFDPDGPKGQAMFDAHQRTQRGEASPVPGANPDALYWVFEMHITSTSEGAFGVATCTRAA